MAESPCSDASHGTPLADGSTTNAPSKTAAAKNKECLYCHQPFTSSSLGRHLDQYIKKKQPDGVHHVDEIRQLRRGITRRTARGGRSKSNDLSEARESPAQTHLAAPAHMSDVDRLNPSEKIRTSWNTPTWQTTGVINGVSGPTSSMMTQPIMPAIPTGTKRSWNSIEQTASHNPLLSRGDLGSERDTARALELALREVLDSLQAASTRGRSASTPLDFDVQSQSFPSLTLLLLPPPPTLVASSIPFSTPATFPISPPDRTHLEVLRLKLAARVDDWKWVSLRAAQSFIYPTATAQNLGEEQDSLTIRARRDLETATKHLDLSFQAWVTLSESERNETWRLEIMRALVREQEKSKKVEAQIERITQEANQLQQQVNHLSRCQWPREMALWPPERIPVGRDIFRMGEGGVEPGRWDYDRLLNKWKRIVREDIMRKVAVKAMPTDNKAATSTTEGSWPPALWDDAGPVSAEGREDKRARRSTNGVDRMVRRSSSRFVDEGGAGGRDEVLPMNGFSG